MTEQFIQERRYLKAVSEKTLLWYRDSFRAFEGALETEAQIKQRIVEIRQRGVKPVSVNSWLRCVKAYWLWQGKDWKIGRLKEEQKILATLTPSDAQALISAKNVTSKAVAGSNLFRAHLVALTILDTGLRASEVLGLAKEDVDFDNLVLKVAGKGGKHRLVPFTSELRKQLFRFVMKQNSRGQVVASHYVFGTQNDTKVSVRNLERDFHVLGEQCRITGVRFSPHTLRHTFAVSYLRNGGNLEFLRRILGHSSLTTTQKYLRSLGVEDLGAVHNQLSPLSARR